jgi:hypothetical protein
MISPNKVIPVFVGPSIDQKRHRENRSDVDAINVMYPAGKGKGRSIFSWLPIAPRGNPCVNKTKGEFETPRYNEE